MLRTVSAELAGYSASYAHRLAQKYNNDKDLRARIEEITESMPERYRTLCKLRLLDVAEIEGAALTKYKSDPRLAIDKPQLLKQIKQAGGIDLNEQQPPAIPTVNIKYCQAIIARDLLNALEGSDNVRGIDAEVESIENNTGEVTDSD